MDYGKMHYFKNLQIYIYIMKQVFKINVKKTLTCRYSHGQTIVQYVVQIVCMNRLKRYC